MTIGRFTGIALAAAALAACGGGEGRNDHPGDGDTGQAAPATVPTPDNPAAPDSTAGTAPMGQRQPGVAGDTASSNAPGGARPPVGDPRRP